MAQHLSFPVRPRRGLRDPFDTQADLREASENAGFGWATSHTLRKTTASILDANGLTAREIADQLGHSGTSLAQDSYLGRKVASTRAAAGKGFTSRSVELPTAHRKQERHPPSSRDS